jgi:hypothetical protein
MRVHFIDYKTNGQILREGTEVLEVKVHAHRSYSKIDLR